MCLTGDHHDALAELINIGVGRAAASLSDLTGERIELSVPRIRVCNAEGLKDHVDAHGEQFDTLVFQDFKGHLTGRAVLGFPRTSGLKFAQLLGNLDAVPSEMDLDLSGILMEVGNIVLVGVLGSIGNLIDTRLSCSVPELATGQSLAALMTSHESADEQVEQNVFVADVRFCVAKRDINGSIAILFEFGGIRSLLDALLAEHAD